MADSNSTKRAKKRKRFLKQITQKTLSCFWGLCLVGCGLAFAPVASANDVSSFSVNATVLLSQEFVEALASNSKVALNGQFFFPRQQVTVKIVFSTGVEILKSEKFACQLRNQQGEVLYVYQAKAEKREVAEFSFEIPTSAVGENIFSCQATDYSQPISIKQQATVRVFPDLGTVFNLLIIN